MWVKELKFYVKEIENNSIGQSLTIRLTLSDGKQYS